MVLAQGSCPFVCMYVFMFMNRMYIPMINMTTYTLSRSTCRMEYSVGKQRHDGILIYVSLGSQFCYLFFPFGVRSSKCDRWLYYQTCCDPTCFDPTSAIRACTPASVCMWNAQRVCFVTNCVDEHTSMMGTTICTLLGSSTYVWTLGGFWRSTLCTGNPVHR